MFRENISEFIRHTKAKLYVPKNGGLNSYVGNMLQEIGVDRNTGEITRNESVIGKLEIILARGSDIPQRVMDSLGQGNLAYGLTGDDLFDEFRLRMQDSRLAFDLALLNTYDWFDPDAEYLRPALCLMNATGNFADMPPLARVAINAKYVRTSLNYLGERFKDRGMTYSAIEYEGDAEFTVSVNGPNNACVEIVYRGNKSPESVKSRSGLKTVEIVRFSDVALIGVPK